MRATGFLLVVSVFVAVALSAYTIILAVGGEVRDFILAAAAITASQVGALVWHRQAPDSAERMVKLGLGTVLSVTSVAFSLILQAVSGWLAYPEVTVPIVAIGCFVLLFAIVGPLWKSLSKGTPKLQNTTHRSFFSG